MNSADVHDFEELLFWGRIEGIKQDYYLCLGITYTNKYEFPEKRFYWASAADFKFKSFQAINDQHYAEFDSIKGMFSGEPSQVLIRVEQEKPPAEEGMPAEQEQEAPKEKDPLASTEEEDPSATFVPRNFTELDRLQMTVFAIENDCHILPKGSVKLTDQHEVRRDNAFKGFGIDDACTLANYSHFRKV